MACFTIHSKRREKADEQTQIRWEVEDLRGELDELRSRGVIIEEYDLPGVKTENGIGDMGFAWIGRIIDPGKAGSNPLTPTSYGLRKRRGVASG